MERASSRVRSVHDREHFSAFNQLRRFLLDETSRFLSVIIVKGSSELGRLFPRCCRRTSKGKRRKSQSRFNENLGASRFVDERKKGALDEPGFRSTHRGAFMSRPATQNYRGVV